MIGTKRLRRIKNWVFTLLFSLALLGLVFSTLLPNWRPQDILSFVAILISLASLFNSIKLPRTVELTVAPEDIVRGRAYVDLGDGSVRSNIIAYNTGEIRARGVIAKLQPVGAPPLTAGQKQMIRSASLELLRSFEQLGEKQPLFTYFLQSNIANPDHFWWLTGVVTQSDKYAEFTEKIMGMFGPRDLPPIELYFGDISSEQETKTVAIPYGDVVKWTRISEPTVQGICSEKVRLSYGYIDETKDGLVTGQYPHDIEIRWKPRCHSRIRKAAEDTSA